MSSSRRSSAGTSTWDRLAGLGERKLQNSMQVEIVDGGAQFEEGRALAAGELESHATSGAGTGSAHGSSATPRTRAVRHWRGWRSDCGDADCTGVDVCDVGIVVEDRVVGCVAVVVIDIPQTLVGSISIVKKVGK